MSHSIMNTMIDSMMETVLIPTGIDQTGMVIYAPWVTENSTPVNFSGVNDAMDTGYASSLSQMQLSRSPEDDNSIYMGEDFSSQSTSSAARNTSIDADPPGEACTVSPSIGEDLTSEAKEDARERRKTQNKFAQRAYRKRKEQALRDQEIEIEALKSQIANEKRHNQVLAQAIGSLKERLKSRQLGHGYGTVANMQSTRGSAYSQGGSSQLVGVGLL